MKKDRSLPQLLAQDEQALSNYAALPPHVKEMLRRYPGLVRTSADLEQYLQVLPQLPKEDGPF